MRSGKKKAMVYQKTKELWEKYRTIPVQAKALLWFLICSFLQKGISVITTPIFTRLLSTAEYGQYSVFYTWLGLTAIFVTLNLSSGVYTQGLVKFSERRKVFSSSLQGLTTALVAVWTVIYMLNRGFWNQLLSLTTVQVLALLVMNWTTAVFNFWAAEQRVEYRYKALILITLAVSICKPAIGVFFVLHAEDKVTARILGIVLVELVAYSGMYLAQMRRGKQFYHAEFWKYALRFNLPLIPHYLSQTVLSSADRIMIERMVGSSEAGIYSLAYSISQIMTLFNTALMQTISPWIYQKIKAKQLRDISSTAYLTLGVIAMVNLLLIALAPEAVAIFAPESYYEAIWVIPPVAMSVYFMYCYDLFAKFAFYYEKTTLIMLGSVFGAVLNVILNYIFIGKYGYRAAGYTTLACYVAYAVGHYFFMNRVCNKNCEGIRPYSGSTLLWISVAFLATGFLLLGTYPYRIVRYGILCVFLIVMVIFRKRILRLVSQLMHIGK